jgi:hypothetical protein
MHQAPEDIRREISPGFPAVSEKEQVPEAQESGRAFCDSTRAMVILVGMGEPRCAAATSGARTS